MFKKIRLFILLIMLIQDIFAENNINPSQEILENIIITGTVEDVAGSANVIDTKELQKFSASDVLRVLQSVPGTYIQEEDGFGLRPNIGIRGSGIDRSGKIALLEDGVLIAPAPYTASSAYYFPTQRRMSSIEILKGPSSVIVGPRTTGGVINFISTPIPESKGSNAMIDMRTGTHDTTDTHVYLGHRGNRLSWLIETAQMKSKGFKLIDVPDGLNQKSSGYDIQDYMLKLQYDNDVSEEIYHSLRIKLGSTQQTSNETYLGLTATDYRLNPYRRYAASSRDQFNGDHEQIQVSYVLDSNNNWRAEVTYYDNDFHRDWFKLQSINGKSQSAILNNPDVYATEYDYITGDADSADDIIKLRHNNRFYNSQGIQGNISYNFDLTDIDFTMRAGFRIHEDYEDRKQNEDGFRMEKRELVLTSLGIPSSKTNRFSKSEVTSYFLDAKVSVGNFILTPGVRVEDIENARYDYATSDPERVNEPTKIKTRSESVTIPGMGILYKLDNNTRLLGGIHKGYQPPGAGSKARPEESINVEIGARVSSSRGKLDAIYFLNNYNNIVGTVTASTGGSAEIGAQYDGGKATVKGLELNAAYNFSVTDTLHMPLQIQYTLTSEYEFDSTFSSGFDGWGDVLKDDEMPYIPKHQMRISAALENEHYSFNLASNYIGKRRSVAGQGNYIESETIPGQLVWDGMARYNFTDTLNGYIKIDNLFNQKYLASRRPAGLRPGLSRTVYIGINYQL